MMELNPVTYPVGEEMEAMTFSTLDFDLLLDLWDADVLNSPPPPSESPAEEWFDPHQPPTGGDMPHGAAPFGLQQPVLNASGCHDAPTDSPLLSPSYAPAEVGFDPQQPPTGGGMPHGAAPFSLQQPVLNSPGCHAAPTDSPLLPPSYAPAEEGSYPKPPPTGGDLLYEAAPFGLQQPVLPAPGPAPPMYQPPTAPQPGYKHPAAPGRRRQVKNVPVTPHWAPETNLTPVGFVNGQIVYALPTYTAPPVTSAVPVVQAHSSQKRKFCRKWDDESKPYVKKPPNAFMIFRTEQRPTVVAELQNPNCALVNKVIGETWRLLPNEEKAKYYEHADREKHLHSQLFPEWSAGDNYGIKRKRIRRKGPMTEYSAM